jgi:hypothetical protein
LGEFTPDRHKRQRRPEGSHRTSSSAGDNRHGEPIPATGISLSNSHSASFRGCWLHSNSVLISHRLLIDSLVDAPREIRDIVLVWVTK